MNKKKIKRLVAPCVVKTAAGAFNDDLDICVCVCNESRTYDRKNSSCFILSVTCDTNDRAELCSTSVIDVNEENLRLNVSIVELTEYIYFKRTFIIDILYDSLRVNRYESHSIRRETKAHRNFLSIYNFSEAAYK